jgi:hypothetical protein
MADTEKTSKGTDYHEVADDSKAAPQPEPEYDPWQRRRVEENEPNFAGSNRNRVNSKDFGLVSAELAEADEGKDFA